eukprot:gene127-122_t
MSSVKSPEKSPPIAGKSPLHRRAMGGGAAGSGTTPRKRKVGGAPRTSDFANSLEHTVHVFAQQEDSLVEDMQKNLMETRKQYDDVHAEAERKETELNRIREAIRIAEMAKSGSRSDRDTQLEEQKEQFQKQYEEAQEKILECTTNKKVYTHVLERSRRELAVLKQKVGRMEATLAKRQAEEQVKLAQCRKISQEKEQQVTELEKMEQDIEHERQLREKALSGITFSLQTKKNAIKRRTDFEKWRQEIALEAANWGFNASAARLRKMWAIEKLAGNCLQKIMFEQVEKSQATEDGFQRIREVTGLTDVMDIVHKFLNREVEHEQLKNASKEAEAKLEAIREEYEQFKMETNGLIFDPSSQASRDREIYQEVERHEAELSASLKEHETAREKLQQAIIQKEHIKRWAKRMAKSLSFFDSYFSFDEDVDLQEFFTRLSSNTIPQLIQEVRNQLSGGRLQRQNFSQAASKEYHEQSRLLNDKEFLRSNCRVVVASSVETAGAPSNAAKSRGSPARGKEDVEEERREAQQEREALKQRSSQQAHEAARRRAIEQNAGKKKAGGGGNSGNGRSDGGGGGGALGGASPRRGVGAAAVGGTSGGESGNDGPMSPRSLRGGGEGQD